MDNGDIVDIGGDRGEGMFYVDLDTGQFIKNLGEYGDVLPPQALNIIMLNGRNYYSLGYYPSRIALPNHIDIEIIRATGYFEHRTTLNDAILTNSENTNYPDDILLINIDGRWIGMEGAFVSEYD